MELTIAGQQYNVEYVDELDGIEVAGEPFITFDTETTGLHLKKDNPFLAAVCIGFRVLVFPSTNRNLREVVRLSRSVKRVYGHNIGYDMHMVSNAGVDALQVTNWGDTMALARLSLEAKSVRHGGDKLSLKYLSKKYVDRHADRYEHEVKTWLSAKRRQDKKVLTAMLKPLGWSTSRLEKALTEDVGIPEDVTETYENWDKAYPKPTYQDVPMDIMLPYVATDVILTKHLVYKFLPVVVERKQEPVMQREFDLMPVVYKMERCGLHVDRDYLFDCRNKLAGYIDRMYAQLYEITGQKFSVGQHAVIKQMYTEMLGKEPPSTDKKFLKKMADKGDKSAALIARIRTFEKWLATYIDSILERSEYDGRLYTQLNQFNPVSGRFSSDLQQMPKYPLLDDDGEVLFHPRRIVKVSGDGWNHLYLMDFSQVELRVQAHYTLYFGGDTNLCRSYMPFECTHYKTGEVYRFSTETDRNRWNERQPNGDSVWIDESGKPWVPTDVHMATTLKALVAMGIDPESLTPKDLKSWRGKGKMFNFGRNYGMGDLHAAEALDIELEQAKALNRGYTDAFPLVVTYQGAVVKTMREQGYMENEYGRRYYLDDWNKHYAVANYLIQGSCADDLKAKMVKIDQFLVKNGCKSRMLLCIHDELVFEIYEGEEWIVNKIKAIMEYTPKIQVPIVAEIECTSTTWDAKKAWEVSA